MVEQQKRARETSVRFREPGDGYVWVSVVVSRPRDRARLLLRETPCRDMGDALEIAAAYIDQPDTELDAMPYEHG